MTEEKLYFNEQRTEEVQYIINRMPTRFGFCISAIVVFIFVMMFVFGWIVRYPDVVNGQITVNAESAPLKLIANSSGKLKLNGIVSMDRVKEGQILAYIENSTDPSSLSHIESLLKQFNPNIDDIVKIIPRLPHSISLGELNGKYYAFVNSLRESLNHKQDKLLDKQLLNYIALSNEQKNSISVSLKRVEMARKSLAYVHKFYSRDSILFNNKVISESELDKTQMNYLSGKDGLQNALNNLYNIRQAWQETESKLQQLSIEKPEKEKELQIALVSAYNDLVDSIKNWKQKYVFIAPFDGKVQFLKFYSENQFLAAGEQVFSVVPIAEQAFGQVVLPAQGSGKIKPGQEVIVKLDNYPYMEFGSITGRIKSISLTTNTTKTEKADIETYMLLVEFPNQLKTNYGSKLDFKAETKGSAEIITNDRRLIQRLFDNLKYVTKK